jgi:nitroreductase
MDLYTAISLRKSVRAFEDREVPEDTLTRLLEGARLAPSANNRQEWRFIVVRDPGRRAQLSGAACGQRFVAEAPVVIACCAETDEHIMTCGQPAYTIDVALATDHLTLCAAAEGLGTCWIGAFHEDRVREVLGIPSHVRVVALLPLGYPRNPNPVPKSRLPFGRIVRYDHWGP